MMGSACDGGIFCLEHAGRIVRPVVMIITGPFLKMDNYYTLLMYEL
jgi:hypothetical protein